VLDPPPAAVVVSRSYSEEEAAETRKVFSQYLSEVGLDKGTVIKITNQVLNKVGKEGVPNWIFEQLEDFKK
jgi:hypothetical protein